MNRDIGVVTPNCEFLDSLHPLSMQSAQSSLLGGTAPFLETMQSPLVLRYLI